MTGLRWQTQDLTFNSDLITYSDDYGKTYAHSLKCKLVNDLQVRNWFETKENRCRFGTKSVKPVCVE